ncbi:Guanine nucleotide-binding protein subunit beta-like protein 1 [Exaiptasia diaphana]|nr:Guanine nucleotide-binding protein subunit beta-like protein 1 [Exaiptasia diaphana]
MFLYLRCGLTERIPFLRSVKGVISLWDLKTKRIHTNIEEHSGNGILGLHITENSKLISHGRDGFINVYNLAGGNAVLETKFSLPVFGFCKFSVLKNEYSTVRFPLIRNLIYSSFFTNLHLFVIVSDNRTWLATASSTQSQIDIVDVESKTILHKLKPRDEKGYGMCMCVKLFVCPETQQTKVLVGYEDGSIRLFDIGSGKMESQLRVHSESVMCMDMDLHTLKVVTGSADNKLVVTDLLSTNELKTHREVEIKKPGIADVKIRSDSKIVCTGGWDNRIRVYSWKTLKPLAILNCHSETVNTIDYSPHLADSGMLMAAGSKDCKISVWSIYNQV